MREGNRTVAAGTVTALLDQVVTDSAEHCTAGGRPEFFGALPAPVLAEEGVEMLLLVAIVEMASDVVAGQAYEDAVLGLLERHGGVLERRMRDTGSATEVHVIQFSSRAGYEAFMIDPRRLELRAAVGDAAPRTRVLEVRDLPR